MNPAERAGVAAWPPGAPPDRGSQGKPSSGFTDLLDQMKARTADAEGQQSKAGDTRRDQDAARLATVGADAATLVASGVITPVPEAGSVVGNQTSSPAATDSAVGSTPTVETGAASARPAAALGAATTAVATAAAAAPTQDELARAAVTIAQTSTMADGQTPAARTASAASVPAGEPGAAGSARGNAGGNGETVQEAIAAGAATQTWGSSEAPASASQDATLSARGDALAAQGQTRVVDGHSAAAQGQTPTAGGQSAAVQGQTPTAGGQSAAVQNTPQAVEDLAIEAGSPAQAGQNAASAAPASTQVRADATSPVLDSTNGRQDAGAAAQAGQKASGAGGENVAAQGAPQAGREATASGQGQGSAGQAQGASTQDPAAAEQGQIAGAGGSAAGQGPSAGAGDSAAARDQGRTGSGQAAGGHGQTVALPGTSDSVSTVPVQDGAVASLPPSPAMGKPAEQSAAAQAEVPVAPVETTQEQTAAAQETLNDAQRSAGAVAGPTTARRSTLRTPQQAAPLHRAVESTEAMLRLVARRGVTQATLSLRPAELGAVEVRLRATADGVVASVAADSSQAAKLLEQSAGELRHALEDSGVRLLRLDIAWSRDPRTGTGASGDRNGSSSTGGNAADPANPTASEPDSTTTVVELPNGVLVDVLA